jgi:hypothetical protein
MTKNKKIFLNDSYFQIIDECLVAKCFLLLEDKQGYSLFLRNLNYVKETKLDTMFTKRTDNVNMTIAEAFSVVNDKEALKAFKDCFKDIYIYTVIIPTNIEERMVPLFVEEILTKKIKCSYD